MIINRYLSREILSTMLVVLSILLVAFLCQQMVRYLNFVAIGKIPTQILLQLVSFEIPYLGALLLPLCLYLAILLAFGRLNADNEMAILKMSGFDNVRITKLVLRVTVVIAFAVLILMLWVNPFISFKRQQLMSSDEATLHLVQTLLPGRFQVSPDGSHVMYVEKISRNHQRAENVFVAEKKKNNDDSSEQSIWNLVVADQGYQIKDPKSDDQFFVTTNGYRYEGVPGQNDYKIAQFKSYKVRMAQPDAKLIHKESESLSSTQLLLDYSNPKHAAELQWRLSVAISVVLLALLAIPLSHVQPRKNRYLMLLPAIIIYVIYFNLMITARHWTEQNIIPSTLGIWWTHLFVFVIFLFAIFISYRQKRLFG